VTTWWSSLFRPRDRGCAARVTVYSTVGFVLFVLSAFSPAAAVEEELRVIAVHTASAPQVSMVVEPPAGQPADESATQTCSVTIDGARVETTMTPMASSDLSIALVIDTAAGMTPQKFAAVQSGATDFLLQLAAGPRTMVIAAGGEPQVVAPLSAKPAEALSAISALRVGGSRAAVAATMLAAQSLESAPPGPRAIIVYTHGPDEQEVPADRLSQAVSHAEAVVDVLQTGTDSFWPSVVDQTGGVVVTTNAKNIVQSFGSLAATLGDQYLVTFEAPGELPAVAQVAFQTGDQEYTTVVTLPDAGPAQAAPTQSSGESPARGVPWLLALVAGLALTVLIVFLRRDRQLRPADGGQPSTEAASADAAPPIVSPPLPRRSPRGSVSAAVQAWRDLDQQSEKARRHPPHDQQPPPVPDDDRAQPPLPATRSVQRRSPRGSLSAAVQGRRSARGDLDQQSEKARRHPPHDQQPPPVPDDDRAQRHEPEAVRRQAASTTTRTVVSAVGIWPLFSGRGWSHHLWPGIRPGEDGREATTVLTGVGDAVVELTNTASWQAAVHITGNTASQYFAVQTLPDQKTLVVTARPYDGVRALDWDGEESTGFEIRATGPWRIETLPMSAIPTFTNSFNGDGNMVVHFTGTGSLVEITGNNEGLHFQVRALSAYGAQHRLVDTTSPYAGSCQISPRPQLFEIQAAGPWTITVKNVQAA
jgi:von Willebrand factor type A domain